MTPENAKNASPQTRPGESPPSQFDETAFSPPDTSSSPSKPPGSGSAAHAHVGKSVGKYQVTGVLGQGAMGVVLKAHDPLIDRDVAIKILADHLAADETALGRFLAEARAAGKLNHPNVTAIHEIFQEGQRYFLVMEFVSGGSLNSQLAQQQAMPVVEATRAMIDACKGVGAAHAAGLVHRDIKPANFMRAADSSIKVADFGLAKTATDSTRHFTQTGAVVGTPFFMSPEQCEARPLDQRSDIYSLGATYFSLLTGHHPYESTESVTQLMYQHCHGPIPDPRTVSPLIPEACCRIIGRAMAKAPADRYQTTDAMLADLQAVLAALSGQAHIALPSESGTVPALRAASATTLPPVSGGKAGMGRLPLVMGAIALLALVGLVVFMWQPWHSTSDGNPPGTDGDGHNGAATSLALVQGVTETEVLLGMTAPFSGSAKELGRDMKDGLLTYFNHVNDNDGIAGRKVKLIDLDDAYRPELALVNMQALYERRKVFAVIGNVGTTTAEQAMPYALSKKMIFFGALTGAPLLRKDPPDRYVFNYRASYGEETAAIVKYLKEIKGVLPEQIAVFAQQDGYGEAGFQGVAKMLRKYGRQPESIVRVGHDRHSHDVGDAVKEILTHKDLRAVIMVSTYRPAAEFIRKLKGAKANLLFANVSFVSGDALAEELYDKSNPDYAAGVIVTQVVPHHDSQSSLVLKYRELLEQYYPSEKPGFGSLEGYLNAIIFCEGLKRAGKNLNTETLVDALESIRDFDIGLGTPLHYGPSEHQASHKVWGTILDRQGKFQILDLE